MFQSTIDFIRKLYATGDFIPLHAPVFSGNEKKYLVDAIDSTFVSSVGPYVNRLEKEMADYAGTARAVAVVNGTAGIQVALRLVGVETNTEVITQALSFIATSNAIAYCSAEPIYLDVDLDTMGLSPIALKKFLEQFGEKRENGTFNKASGKKIAACLPMHTFGFLCRIEEISAICKDWNIPLIEDAAEAIGSGKGNKKAGAFGDMGVYSFNGNKIITSGGGGIIVTNDEKLADKAKYLTTTAKVPHPWEFYHDEVGYNFRLPNLNAALLCAQLESLDAFILDKTDTFKQYAGFFENHSIRFKIPLEGTYSNHWLMSIELESRTQRETFLKEANDQGIMCRPIWTLNYKLPMYQHCQRDAQTNAEHLEDRIVNIPSSVKSEYISRNTQ